MNDADEVMEKCWRSNGCIDGSSLPQLQRVAVSTQDEGGMGETYLEE